MPVSYAFGCVRYAFNSVTTTLSLYIVAIVFMRSKVIRRSYNECVVSSIITLCIQWGYSSIIIGVIFISFLEKTVSPLHFFILAVDIIFCMRISSYCTEELPTHLKSLRLFPYFTFVLIIFVFWLVFTFGLSGNNCSSSFLNIYVEPLFNI